MTNLYRDCWRLPKFTWSTGGLLVAACLMSVSMNVPAHAEGATVNGDIEYGEYHSSECAGCHQLSGSDDGIPSIVGLDPEGFVAIMKAYRSKDIDHQAMQLIAGRLDDEMIASLAVYFGSLPVPE